MAATSSPTVRPAFGASRSRCNKRTRVGSLSTRKKRAYSSASLTASSASTPPLTSEASRCTTTAGASPPAEICSITVPLLSLLIIFVYPDMMIVIRQGVASQEQSVEYRSPKMPVACPFLSPLTGVRQGRLPPGLPARSLLACFGRESAHNPVPGVLTGDQVVGNSRYTGHPAQTRRSGQDALVPGDRPTPQRQCCRSSGWI